MRPRTLTGVLRVRTRLCESLATLMSGDILYDNPERCQEDDTRFDNLPILAYNRFSPTGRSQIVRRASPRMPRKAARHHLYRPGDIVRLIVTTREKFPRNARWNHTIRRALFRLLHTRPLRVPSRRRPS